MTFMDILLGRRPEDDRIGPPALDANEPDRIGPPPLEAGPDPVTPLPKAQPAPAPQPAAPAYDWRNDPNLLDAVRTGVEGIHAGANQIGDASLALIGKDPRGRAPYKAEGLRDQIEQIRQNDLYKRHLSEIAEGRKWQEGQSQKQEDWKSGESALDRASRERIAASRGTTSMSGEVASPEILDTLKSVGIDLPPGTKMGSIKSILGPVLTAKNLAKTTPLRERSVANAENKTGIIQEQGEKRIDLAQQNTDLAADRLGVTKQKMAQVSEATATKDIAPLITSLERTAKLKQDFKENPDLVGPFSGRWNTFINSWGFGTPEASTFLANLDTEVFQNLYQLSGKQINENERRDLKQTVFDAYKNGASFEALLDNYDARLRQILKNKLGAIEATGRDVEGLRKMEPGKKFRIEVNGQTFDGDEESVRKLEAKGIPYTRK